ncbi:chromosome segregation protein SMC [Candidatus Woesearchaeota archaeon]|nr:chromosome segregation protein SMC [Candidatus Woesearchaeota archaeon]
MTRINKLVMYGFKSFARRTELVFDNSFNCVLGPNGSGKSNILDALCFVLGRMSVKSLRAEKAANLVYNGGKTKKPMKQAEVSIYFDNSEQTFPTEDPYVKITRIVKHDGQSLYKINDKKRTRQQILDLMSVAKIDPDGYNIILQGDIVRFTEMHPEDRRMLIEEISGISIYEEKKQKAMRELEKVEERLKDANIILTERNTYLNELKKDRDQALKFKDLKSKVNENKASYLYIQIDKKEKEKEHLNQRIQVEQDKLNQIKSKIDEIKQVIENKKEEINNINKEIEEKGEKEQVEMQRSIEQLKVKLATNKTRIENCRNEIDKIFLRKNQLEKDLKELDNQIQELNSKKKELNEKKNYIEEERKKIVNSIEEFKKKNEIDNVTEIEKGIDQIDKDAVEKQKEIEELRGKEQDLLRKEDVLNLQINTVDEKIKKVKQVEEEHKEQIEQIKKLKEDFKKSILELNKRLNESSILAQQISENKRKLAGAEEELAKLKTRIASIKENISGNIALKNILEQKNKIKGIYGTITELADVDSKYSSALEIAAGPRLNSVIVDSDKVAVECIKYLKKNKLGIVTFLPLNKIKPKSVEEAKKYVDEKGVYGIAVDLLSYDKKFEKVFSYVFGNTIVVDNIDTARKIGVGNVRMVTIDGDLVELSGAMQGGYRLKRKKGMSFQAKNMVQGEREQKKAIDELEDTISVLEKRQEENDKVIEKLREEKASLEGEIIKQEKSLHLEKGDLEADENTKQELQKELEIIEEGKGNLNSQIDEVNKGLTQVKIKKQQLRNRINELRNPALLAELNAFEDKKKEFDENLMQIDSDIRNITIQINDMKLPEKAKIGDILKQQAKEEEGFNGEIKGLNEQIQNDKKSLAEKEEKAQEFYTKYKELFVERTKVNDDIQKEENKIDGLREESKEIEIKMNKVSLVNAEVNAKLAGLKEEFQQYEGVQINKEKSEEELKKDIQKFERMVNDMGNVNLRALEIYDEIEKEYQGLLEKKDKLESEKGDVLEMMGEIEGKKKELFMRTFDIVNENFKRIFSALSTKGEASLVLQNEENPFEGGLNIRVRITGKKFLDIRSLSGGEKTLTALAFIFSIQEYEPHSFYILDEVDAALDKHNSEKLSGLIRKYVEKAQYIVISHNDAVISEADNLYGISMNEHGISQVTSLKI